MRFTKVIILAAMLVSTSSAVLAQEWIAERLRGRVLQLEGGSWTALERGDVVPDGSRIRTLGDGRVELVRGQERIALASNTEIAIRDAAGQKMTSVIQILGGVTIEAERRNVQHFSVQTPVLAAVVKGTQFTVTYSNGQARVDVDRGVVQVQDSAHSMVADVTPGQSAAASRAEPLDVSGPGADATIYLIEGAVVPAAAREAVLGGVLDAEDALEAVQARAVPDVSANASGNGNGPPEHSNAGGNSSSNPGNNSNGNGNASSANGSSSSNAGPPAHSNAGGNGGGGPPEHSNAGGNSSNAGNSGNGNGPPAHSNAGGNGKGKGKKDD